MQVSLLPATMCCYRSCKPQGVVNGKDLSESLSATHIWGDAPDTMCPALPLVLPRG